jgi:hypothetical protein
MEVLVGALGLLLVGVATLGFLEIQSLKQEQNLLTRSLDSTDDMIDNKISPQLEELSSGLAEASSGMELMGAVIGNQDKRLNEASRKLEVLSKDLSNKQNKTMLSIDEALAKLDAPKRKKVEKSVKNAEKTLKTALIPSSSSKKTQKARK